MGDPNIILNSFIVSPTRYGALQWGETIQELEDKHVLFMAEDPEGYIGKLMNKIRSEEMAQNVADI
ncbi:hypothetical protein RMSM_07432 [Rhodopirellula maiorica SM1]|uniref:Uncharacterized protein n=1 Tax=Rhodopirellula maiorica SM1 TaxID=1265738 RepID=M5R834_9BACT|nr:hypothetical protein RMSM_07432 [Rhodopirellula maiorica SM1]